MTPIKFEQANRMWAENQDEYKTLPAFTNERETISCWKLTWGERLQVLLTGRLWLRQCNFGAPLQPQLPQTETPFVQEK